MATIIRYVNTASSGGDGTTNATSGGTAAYASLSAAEAALRQDLTGVVCDVADEQGNNYIALDILCSGTAADGTAVDFSSASWVTNATHRLRVRLNGTGAGAKWDSGLYRLVGSPGYGVPMIYVTSGISLTLQDLQVESQSTLDNAPHAFRANDFGYNVHIVGGFYRTTSTTGTPDDPMTFVVRPNTGTAKLYMSNVTIVAATGAAFDILNTTSATFEVYAYNCTMVCRAGTGNVFGFTLNASPTSRFKNLLLQSAAGSNYVVGNAAPTETATILTRDATSPTVGLRSKTLTFVDATNWDYHLTSSDTDAIGAGTDLSADSYYPFSTDGDGTTRSGTWDVGADEYVLSSTTLYFLDSAASGSNFGQIQVGGSPPSTATTATGWTVDTVGATNYALMAYASERASTVFSGTAQPAGNPDNSLGDCFRSTSTLTGDFATGAWTIAVPVIAVSAAAGQDGRVRVRLWKSSNATGTSPTEITSGAVAGTTVTNLTTGAEQVSTVTTGSITGFSMANEYLFVQIAWEITGAAT